MAQLVRVCRSCHHINTAEGSDRCDNCWLLLTGVDAIPQEEGEQLASRRRPIFLRRPTLFFGLALVLAFIGWRLALLFDLSGALFPPPGATTNLSASTSPQAWGQARRAPENTGFTPDQAPRPERIRWTFATSKTLLAAPAVVDDRVYLSTEDRRMVALDGRSGRLIWEYQTGAPSGSTPAVAGDLVIFVLRPGLIVALDRVSGAPRWEVDIRAPIFASPVVVDGSVYIGAGDSQLHALDAATGEERWTFDAKDWIVSSVAYADGTIAVSTQDSSVFLVDPKTGHERLYFDTGYVRFGGGPVILGDQVYFPSDRGFLWSIDRKAKGYPLERIILKVKLNLYVWQILKNSPIQKGGLWTHRLGGDLRFTPAVAHDTLYVVNLQGQVFARDAETGSAKWDTTLPAEISAAPTVAGQTVLVGTVDGRVFGLDAGTGTILWDFKTGDEITDSPIVVGDTIYVVSDNGTLYALDGSQ